MKIPNFKKKTSKFSLLENIHFRKIIFTWSMIITMIFSSGIVVQSSDYRVVDIKNSGGDYIYSGIISTLGTSARNRNIVNGKIELSKYNNSGIYEGYYKTKGDRSFKIKINDEWGGGSSTFYDISLVEGILVLGPEHLGWDLIMSKILFNQNYRYSGDPYRYNYHNIEVEEDNTGNLIVKAYYKETRYYDYKDSETKTYVDEFKSDRRFLGKDNYKVIIDNPSNKIEGFYVLEKSNTSPNLSITSPTQNSYFSKVNHV